MVINHEAPTHEERVGGELEILLNDLHVVVESDDVLLSLPRGTGGVDELHELSH